MKKNLKAFLKQLFGARYEHLKKSLLSGLILFFAIYAAEIRLLISPFILFLTSTLFTAGIMWQALNASSNTRMLQGMFLLPFESRELTMAYAFALSGYTLITKTMLIWSVIFAVSRWNLLQTITALLCGCNACFVTMAAYAMFSRKRYFQAVLWAIGVLGVLVGIRHSEVVLIVQIISLCIANLYLLSVDAYIFYRPGYSSTMIRYKGRRGSIMVYLLRYMITNKNYLINTFGLMAVACFLPFLFGQFKGIDVMPLGFAVLCLNTPICILLSCDPDLEQAVRMLPGQFRGFCIGYCLFIFIVNMVVNSIYLCSWYFQYRNVGILHFLLIVLFALQSAILSVLLEWIKPIRGWKIESDLWHHPRKYVVPLLMMFGAAFISIWSFLAWLWLGVLILECLGLIFIARRV